MFYSFKSVQCCLYHHPQQAVGHQQLTYGRTTSAGSPPMTRRSPPELPVDVSGHLPPQAGVAVGGEHTNQRVSGPVTALPAVPPEQADSGEQAAGHYSSSCPASQRPPVLLSRPPEAHTVA